MQIIISDDAKSAITDIYDYSYNISSNYASRIVNQIYDAIYNLQDSPYIGRYVPELSDKHFRELICEKYRIIYWKDMVVSCILCLVLKMCIINWMN